MCGRSCCNLSERERESTKKNRLFCAPVAQLAPRKRNCMQEITEKKPQIIFLWSLYLDREGRKIDASFQSGAWCGKLSSALAWWSTHRDGTPLISRFQSLACSKDRQGLSCAILGSRDLFTHLHLLRKKKSCSFSLLPLLPYDLTAVFSLLLSG